MLAEGLALIMRTCGPTLERLVSIPYLAVSLSTKNEEEMHEYKNTIGKEKAGVYELIRMWLLGYS